MSNNLISIIVPVYKTEKYLDRCIQSLVTQTYTNLEIILVDDGSPDACPKMCDEWAERDSRIKVIHKENGGVSCARNAGIDIASGDYITFVDSDDWVDSEMYQAMISKANEYDCDIVMCDCAKEYSDHSDIYTHDIREGFYDHQQLIEEYYPHLLMMENVEYPATISNCLMLIRSHLLKNIRYIDGVRFSEDLVFGAQVMTVATSFYYVKGMTYYHYFNNDSSASHSFAQDKWNDYKTIYARAFTFFESIKTFDFSKQIDLMLLFFVYNAVGDIIGKNMFSKKEKKERAKQILNDKDVKDLFKRLRITDLNISFKLKIVTLIYKYKLGLFLLV